MTAQPRSVWPPEGTVRPFDFPPCQAEVLDNGLQVRSVQVGRVPVVTTVVVLDAGEGLLDHVRGGLSVLTGDCLEGGTAKRNGVELAGARETVGAVLSSGTGGESTTGSLSRVCAARG